MVEGINISPLWASLLFIVAVVAGHLYRANWKNGGATWKLWLYGCISGVFFLIVAFVPIIG